MEVFDNEEKNRNQQSQKKASEGRKKHTMTPLKAITTLLFLIAVIYLFGLVWVSVAGASAPIGLQFWYPYIPGIGSANTSATIGVLI